MKLYDEVLGECEVEIQHGRHSSVDSFLDSGYSVTLDRELTSDELERLQDEHSDDIQMESYQDCIEEGHYISPD